MSCDGCIKGNKDTCAINTETPMSIMLQTTDRCNELCSFCWHKEKPNLFLRDLEKDGVENLIQFLLSEYKGINPIITFSGGEPTLNMDVVTYAVGRVKETFDKYYVALVSNAVIYSEKLIEMIKTTENSRVLFSLPRENSRLYHDRLKNIIKYNRKQKELRGVEFLITITPRDIGRITNIIKKWMSYGILNINILFEYQDYEVLQDNNLKRLEKILINDLDKLKQLHDDNFVFIKNFKQEVNEDHFTTVNKMKYPTKIAVFQDGYIYTDSRHKYFGADSIGTITDGINFARYLEFLEELPCYTCDISQYCNIDYGAFVRKNKVVDNKSFCFYQRILSSYKRGDR